MYNHHPLCPSVNTWRRSTSSDAARQLVWGNGRGGFLRQFSDADRPFLAFQPEGGTVMRYYVGTEKTWCRGGGELERGRVCHIIFWRVPRKVNTGCLNRHSHSHIHSAPTLGLRPGPDLLFSHQRVIGLKNTKYDILIRRNENEYLRNTPFSEYKSILCRVIPSQSQEAVNSVVLRHGQHPRLPHLSRVISLDLRFLSWWWVEWWFGDTLCGFEIVSVCPWVACPSGSLRHSHRAGYQRLTPKGHVSEALLSKKHTWGVWQVLWVGGYLSDCRKYIGFGISESKRLSSTLHSLGTNYTPELLYILCRSYAVHTYMLLRTYYVLLCCHYGHCVHSAPISRNS